ncbi:MAG TPA: ABC transporter substrate-binding protein, partial [Oligoflexia bacterium]|nr:ABC transporter substrate-binding protein [Oligoflexia bacterium]
MSTITCRAVILFFVLLAVLFRPDIAKVAAQTNEDAELRIGAILPLSGAGATFGQRVKRAMELAHKDLAPEIRGKVRVIFEDDAWAAKGTVSAFQKLVNVDQAHAITVLGSGSGMAVAPLAEQKGIILMAIGASNINVVKGRKYCFLNWVTPEAEAEKLVQEIARRKYQKLALVGAEQEGMISIYNAVLEEIKKAGMQDKIHLDERFMANETDYRTFIVKARSRMVDGAVLFLLPGSIASFAKQARQSGFGADLIGIELFEDDNEVRAAEGALNGQWYVTAASAPAFEKRYFAEYQENSAFA